MDNKKTASQILREAAEILKETGRWTQKSWFIYQASFCRMCAHGAIAYCAMPLVRDRILANEDNPGKNVCLTADHTSYNNDAMNANLTLSQYIDKYNKYYHLDNEADNADNKVNILAHYLASKVGLSMAYNDHPNRTKQEVIDKLLEAATLGEQQPYAQT